MRRGNLLKRRRISEMAGGQRIASLARGERVERWEASEWREGGAGEWENKDEFDEKSDRFSYFIVTIDGMFAGARQEHRLLS